MGHAVFPDFKILEEGKTTDFNDLHLREGLDTVRAQLLGIKYERVYVSPLGHRGAVYFFTSSDNQQIAEMTSFSDVQCFDLMPKEYWETSYPAKTGIDW